MFFNGEVMSVNATFAGENAGGDGITPHIGENGNWYIGETDTGMPSRGADGMTPSVVLTRRDDGAGISVSYPDNTFSSTFVKDGKDGKDGSDYVLTEADKAEIVQLVIESLGGNPVFGYVDENNNIIVSGNLPNGTYTVKYEMEDGSTVAVGDLVLDNNVYYSITNTLTNCVNSNGAAQIVADGSYSATISANSGYELSSVAVTMGGADITADVVSGGNISIANVTGDIVITAVAEETEVEITNWIEEVGYTADTRLSLSSGGTTTASGYECTGFIPVEFGDVLRVKNIDLTNENSTNIIFYDDGKNPIVCSETRYGIPLAMFFATSEGNGVYKGTIAGTISPWTAPSNVAFIRMGSQSITADSILTVNEAIV